MQCGHSTNNPLETEEKYSIQSIGVFAGRMSDHESADAQEVCV